MDTFDIIRALCQQTPKAYAIIRGAIVNGSMLAYEFGQGTIIVVEAFGLPVTGCGLGIHAMHIHEGGNCSGSADEPFADTGGHYSTNSCPHPYHTGDLPPLFSNDGLAWMAVYIDKFTPEDIVGRTIVIHAGVGDFTSQPSGNAGAIIACGAIRELYQ
ncbi:superoxide dismutase family protein [uncultured Thomasclavelia sp.]|uniref:superoxide dismutase family protein n=1 Tax=uncultured Thomasclavelia sp. TaxID=3025759 RepID=UPI002630CC43|nr:superoxide dismutase family protein [uncultured Thomasclavelia sp.]